MQSYLRYNSLLSQSLHKKYVKYSLVGCCMKHDNYTPAIFMVIGVKKNSLFVNFVTCVVDC